MLETFLLYLVLLLIHLRIIETSASPIIRGRDCGLMDTVSDVLQGGRITQGKRITQEDKSRSKYSKIKKTECEDQECPEWRQLLCAWEVRIKLSIAIASLRVSQSLVWEKSSYTALLSWLPLCLYFTLSQCKIMCLVWLWGVSKQGQALPWGKRMRRTLAALTAELPGEGKAAGSYIFGRSG